MPPPGRASVTPRTTFERVRHVPGAPDPSPDRKRGITDPGSAPHNPPARARGSDCVVHRKFAPPPRPDDRTSGCLTDPIRRSPPDRTRDVRVRARRDRFITPNITTQRDEQTQRRVAGSPVRKPRPGTSLVLGHGRNDGFGRTEPRAKATGAVAARATFLPRLARGRGPHYPPIDA